MHTQSSQKASDVKGGRKGFQHDWMKVKMRATALGIARMIKMKESRKTKSSGGRNGKKLILILEELEDPTELT